MTKPTPLISLLMLCLSSMIAPAAIAAGAIDGAPSFRAGQDPGVYIWRENGNWQMQVASGGKWQNVKGSFTTNRQIQWATGIALEGNDVLRVNSNTAEFDLNTNANDFIDGVTFSVPGGAGLCLQSGGSFGSRVYLGPRATPATSPVDLLGNGACGGGGGGGGGGAGTVDGTPSFRAGQDPGVYVWRQPNGNWQMQVASGGKWQNAKGSFTANRQIQWATGVALEGNDVLRLNSNTVEFDLKTNANDFIDGVTFSVPAGTGICLQSGGSFGGEVYLGARATPATSPVDLLGNGACGSGGGNPGNNGDSALPPGGSGGGLKYNPGHYIAMNDWEWQRQASMVEAATKAGVRGIVVRYLWKDLEPSMGNYNFSVIASDLQLMADHGVQLIARIEDKSFKRDVRPTPSYMWGNHTMQHRNNGGWIAKRWTPYVTDRMGALTRAMGARFDNHPNFEGVTFEESSPGVPDAQLRNNGYTPERYRDETIRMLRNTRNHFPKSQVFWSMNFFPMKQEYIGQIANAVASNNIAMGGPDILPDDDPLRRLTYPYYRQFKDRMVLFGSVQYVGYNHLRNGPQGKYWTPAALFHYAVNQLHVDYIFWTQKQERQPWDSHNWLDALPVIRNNPTFNQ